MVVFSPSRDQAHHATSGRGLPRVSGKLDGVGNGSDYGARIEIDDGENGGGLVSWIAEESEIDVHGAVSFQLRDQLPKEPAQA
jgi:hypothetical protein